MTHSLKLFSLVLVSVLLFSFTPDKSPVYTGTYGVGEADPSKITLTINADNTFSYQDYSVATAKIDISGSWTAKGDRVVLKANDPKVKFHKVWLFDKDGKVAKSRKGLCWYRLCRM